MLEQDQLRDYKPVLMFNINGVNLQPKIFLLKIFARKFKCVLSNLKNNVFCEKKLQIYIF